LLLIDCGFEMNLFKEGWFSEQSEGWPGIVQSLKVDKVLHQERSKFQDISILKTPVAGLVMTLDGVIQSTELDEFAYQEMLAHVALYSHKCPKHVLIVGGGDCGVAREVLKHSCVEKVVQCEIDQRVTELSKQYLPHMTCSIDDPRFEMVFGDGAAYVRDHPNSFDVIITDSSDPIGPADVLFNEDYYRAVHKALTEEGIAVSQGESIWLGMDIILRLKRQCVAAGFKDIEYSIIQIPTYPGGSIGAFIASKGGSCKVPKRIITKEEQEKMKYYNKGIHEASFVLPEFFRRKFEE